MKIYVIGGKAKCGKNTFGEYLREELKDYGYKPCVMHITEPLYTYARNYFEWNGNDQDKPREFLQKMGIEIIREKLGKKNFLLKRLYEELLKNGYRVYLGNSTINKEKCITCGIPLIMEIGPRDLERNIIEVTCRDTLELKEFNNDHQFFDEVNWLLKKIQSRMYNKVLIKTTKSEKKVFNLGDLHNNKCEEVNKVMWCGDLNCLEQVKKHTNFISFNQQFHVGECLFCFKKAKHVISIIKKVKN